MTISDDELDARLRALAWPNHGIDPAAALSLTRAAAAHSRQRKRRSVWLVPTALIAVGVLAIPTTAVAVRVFEAQTSEFSEETTKSEAGNEWIYTGAPDYETYLNTIVPRHLPTPEGFNWEAEVATHTGWYKDRHVENGLVEDATLIADFEQILWLAWIAEWIRADQRGDDAARETAMAVLREAPSWPNIASSDGGGIRYGMWAFVARMNVSDPAARSSAAQALAERETGAIARVDRLIELGITDAPSSAEQLAARGPSFRALYELWDHNDRQPLIAEILAGYAAVSTQDDASAGSPFWDDYDRALAELAAKAGVADPVAAVGHNRLGPELWKGEQVWKGEQAEDGSVE